MIKRTAILLSVFLTMSVLAQGSTDEIVYRESKRLKAAGITSLALGTTTMACGIVLSVSNYNDFKEGGSRANEENARKKARGGYAAGGLITALGVGINLTAIPTFQRRKRMIENARAEQPHFSLIAKPNGLTFVTTF